MKQVLCALVAVLAAACTQAPRSSQTADAAPPPPPPLGCTAQTAHDWSAVGSQYYVVEAEAHGDDCASARATLRIKSRDGVVLFEKAYDVAAIPLAFNPNNDQTGLRSDLEGWATNAADVPTADTLPPWPGNANKPPHFQPLVRRAQYEAARGAQGPIFCYPDGAESNACVAMSGDHATLLGSLTPESE